ncbi:MAG TPA: alpha/beta hydrolase [Ilumatobacteraceae bacterium]|nr:alpha/beta hydrolase [Ilumatobacteraceae bacterium]
MKAARAAACCAAVLLAACGGANENDPSSTTSVPDSDDTPDLVIARDMAVADVTTADVFAPWDADGVPVVVMFHGSDGRRSNMDPRATEMARSGAVVVVPSWPVITERPPSDTAEDVYFDQTAAAVCAVRFARSTAAEHGGDPADLTVMAHSAGAPLGARVALVEEPPWPGIDCYPDVSSHVDRFVGTAGDFAGESQYSSWIPDVYRPYDVFDLDVTNGDLEMRLIHGVDDWNVWVAVSTSFDEHLEAVGIDSDLVYVDTAHGELIDPSTPAGRLLADQLDALVHEQPSVFDEPGARATMTFDDDGCSFDGAATTSLGRPLRVRLVADTDVPVWFSMLGFGPGLTDAEMTALITGGPVSIDDPTDTFDMANFVRVEADSEGEMNSVFVDDSLRWVAYCMPDAGSTHPAAGVMHAASEVAVEP